MTAPRYPDEYLPLVEGARPAMEEATAFLLAHGKRADDVLLFVHPKGDAPNYAADLVWHTDTATVGLATRALYLKSRACTAQERETLATPPPRGAVQILAHLRRGAKVWCVPMQVELRAAGGNAP